MGAAAGGGAAADGDASLREPQALADLFREDSRGELAALDVEEHLQAQAQALAAQLDSPAAAALPRVLESVVLEASAFGSASEETAGGVTAAAAPASSGNGGLPAAKAAAMAVAPAPSQAAAAAAAGAAPAGSSRAGAGSKQRGRGSPGKCVLM